MTVQNLQMAFDLCAEIEESGGTPHPFVYQRTTGESLFAVFQTIHEIDLHSATEVVAFAKLSRPYGGWTERVAYHG